MSAGAAKLSDMKGELLLLSAIWQGINRALCHVLRLYGPDSLWT